MQKHILGWTQWEKTGRIRLPWSNDNKKEEKLKLYNLLTYVLSLTIILTNLLHNSPDVKCLLFIL